jgi:hypothetical protein
MKKIFFIMLLSAGTLFASAQYTQKATALTTTSYGNALDTVTNTATKVTTPLGLEVIGTKVFPSEW